MKKIMISRVVKSFNPLLPLIIISLLNPFCFTSCQKEEKALEQKKPTVTIDNLHTAYAKEMNRVKMYKIFQARAAKEKNKQISKLYKAIARSEEIQAQRLVELLRKNGIQPQQPSDENITVGTTLQTLKMALSMEDIEYGSMYPNLIRTADAEKYDEAIKQFTNAQDADTRHADLIRYAISQNGRIPDVVYYICPLCGYIFESKNSAECPTCKTKINEFEVISKI
jgi:rubrerythrin